MCTVSFIPAGDRLFIAHNRDEKILRPRAIAPREYRVKGHMLLFPRDTQSGGTWVAVNAGGDAAVLLNGAFEKHISRPPYRKSRGLVLPDIMATNDPVHSWQHLDLEGTEPFTMVLWSREQLYEARWDGQLRHLCRPDSAKAHTWSSVTLYDAAVLDRRREWFARWREQCPQPALEDVLQYHLYGGEGDEHNDLRMNRDNRMLTVSVTAMELSAARCRMTYMDLQGDTVNTQDFPFTDKMLIKPSTHVPSSASQALLHKITAP